MRRKLPDLTGQIFTDLSIVGKDTSKSKTFWLCQCKCGTIRSVFHYHLVNGLTKSCGCRKLSPDYTGQRFGGWVLLLKASPGSGGRTRYVARCDCGDEKIVVLGSVLEGTSKGCRHCARRLPEGDAARRALLLQYKKAAKDRGYSWDIPEERFNKLTKTDCFYCGLKPSSIYKTNTRSTYTYNGIDRKDNDLGYEPTNVVSCCKTCNYAKRMMSQEAFLGWVFAVFRHSLADDLSSNEDIPDEWIDTDTPNYQQSWAGITFNEEMI